MATDGSYAKTKGSGRASLSGRSYDRREQRSDAMKIVVFEAEPREDPAFEKLKGGHDLVLVEAPPRADSAAAHAYPDVVPTFIYSEPPRPEDTRAGKEWIS